MPLRRDVPFPVYATGMLTESIVEDHPVLRWGDGGPILAAWADKRLPWDGRVRVGGFVERLHALEIADMELVIVEIVGGCFTTDYRSLASLEEMKRGIFARSADTEPIGAHMSYPFVLDPESHFAALAQDALVAGLAVDAVGRLATDDQAIHSLVGLPLMMEALSLLR